MDLMNIPPIRMGIDLRSFEWINYIVKKSALFLILKSYKKTLLQMTKVDR